jgi:hypothetical protein
MQLEVYESVLYHEAEPQLATSRAEAPANEIPKLDATIALWLILFVLGGGLLALYYSGIQYFPEVSWQDALTFMALMTIIGGSLLIAYGFLLLAPGAIWSEFLVGDDHLRYVLMMRHRRLEPCVWSIAKRVLFPFALFMASCHFLLFQNGPTDLVPLGAAASLLAVTGLLLVNLRTGLEQIRHGGAEGHSSPSDPKPDKPPMNRYRLLVAACHLPLLGAFIAKAGFHVLPASDSVLRIMALLPLLGFVGFFRNLRTESLSRDPKGVSLLCRAALAFGSAALLSLSALWFFHRIYTGGPAGAKNIPPGLLILCTLLVIVTNLIVATLFQEHRRQAVFASFLAAMLLLGAGQLLKVEPENTLPARIMQKYGFGGQTVRLVVTERGGRLLCQQGIPVEFESLAAGTSASSAKDGKDKPRGEGRLAFADNLTILSRLGSQFLLRVDKDRTLVLPKEDVFSWSTLSKSKREKLAFRDDCKPGV